MPTTQNTVIDTITFDNNQLCIIDHDNKPWITSADLAKALGYSMVDAITKIYNRNKDEFCESMTVTPNLGVTGSLKACKPNKTRIFSPRGCHLIAMFARTEKAKLFRKWVLDVLEHYQFGDGHGTPVYEVDEPHTLDGHMPSIMPIKFNGDEVPFTFYGGRYWLNAYNLGRLLNIDDHQCNKKVKKIWYRHKDTMPEDGSRLVTWCRIGRTSGERVFDLATSCKIAINSGTGNYGLAAAVWLQDLTDKLTRNKNNALPNHVYDHIYKAKALNLMMGDSELGERAQIHELIDNLLGNSLVPKS